MTCTHYGQFIKNRCNITGDYHGSEKHECFEKKLQLRKANKRCSRCGRYKPPRLFLKNSDICKHCKYGPQNRKQRKRRLNPGEAECIECGDTNTTNFLRSKKNKSGFETRCNKCRCRKSREYQRKMKEKGE